MIEQIISYICIFILGIFFANRNRYMQLFSESLQCTVKSMQDNIKIKALGARYIFDTHYYSILGKAKLGKYYGEIRSDLEHIKFIIGELIGEQT